MQIPDNGPQVLQATTKLPLAEERRPQASANFPRAVPAIPPVVRHASPKTSYAICTNPRSGSWLLSQGLASTSRAGYPLEWLNIGEEQKRSASWHISFPDNSALPDYLGRVLERGTTSNGIFGIKLQYYQFVDLGKRMAAVNKFKGLPVAKFMSTVFPNVQYLWLTRRDKARQAISFYKAYKTGDWWALNRAGPAGGVQKIADVDFDPWTIKSLEEILRQNDIGWQSYFNDNRIEPLTLFYEDFAARYAESVRTVLKWLDIPEAETVPIRNPRLRRQSDAQTEEWLAEYLKFKEAPQHKVEGGIPLAEPAIEIVSPLYDLTTTFRERARIPQRPYKVLSLLEAFRKLESLRPGMNAIQRRSKLSRDDFLQQFYASNRPVIIQDLMRDWPATSLWTPKYLKVKAGTDLWRSGQAATLIQTTTL